MLDDVYGAYQRHGRTLRSPSFWILANYYVGRWALGLPWPARRVLSSAYGVGITTAEFLFGTALHRETEIGPGLHLVHGNGIRIALCAKIGARVGVMQGVTIGTSPDRPGAPEIGDDVFIGAGAQVLGPVKIGARARIAANSLVIFDVPADATAIGVPARVLRYTGRPNPPTRATADEAGTADRGASADPIGPEEGNGRDA
jgi:serine O-acetyltransferase